MFSQAKTLVRRTLPETWLMHAHAIDHYWRGDPELRILKHLLSPDDMALDIGANIGTHTYFMARHARSVVAYEPIPLLAERLQRVFPNVSVRQAAVSDRMGAVELQVPVRAGRQLHEASTISGRLPNHDELVTITVPCVTVDSESFDHVDFLKIDVEQHEFAVLDGASQTIKTSRPLLMVEVSPLLYDLPLFDNFSEIISNSYFGIFCYQGRYYHHSQFDAARHCNQDLFPMDFMGNNIILVPDEKKQRVKNILS